MECIIKDLFSDVSLILESFVKFLVLVRIPLLLLLVLSIDLCVTIKPSLLAHDKGAAEDRVNSFKALLFRVIDFPESFLGDH